MLTAAAAFCLAASGTVAVTWAAPSAPPVQATDMLSFHSLIRPHHAGTAGQPAQASLAEQVVMIAAADQVAAAHAAASVAARVAVAHAAHAAHVAHEAVQRAAARRAARATATRVDSQEAAQQAAVQLTATALTGAPRQIAAQLLARYGWAGQFSCLDELWGQESGWNVFAQNPSSGAYGIPQALPGSKMASAGPDWESDAAIQISWGLGYIGAVYGSPCAAWDHEEANGWY